MDFYNEKYREWQKQIDLYNCLDVKVSPVLSNVLKNWCIENNYVYQFFCQDQDSFIYLIAKSKELLKQHEEER